MSQVGGITEWRVESEEWRVDMVLMIGKQMFISTLHSVREANENSSLYYLLFCRMMMNRPADCSLKWG